MKQDSVIPKDAVPPKLLNQHGQRIGAKGQRTRQLLINVTIELLERHGLRDLTVFEVARIANTSPATFYVYFNGVPEVVLEALRTARQTSPRMLELIEEEWIGEAGLAKAREFVSLYCELWAQNRIVFRVRNLAAEEGDARFLAARRDATRDLIFKLAARIEVARGAGRVASAIDGPAQAAAILILLERLAAVGPLIDDGPDYGQIQISAADMVAHAMGAI